jgi:hypothetical protein
VSCIDSERPKRGDCLEGLSASGEGVVVTGKNNAFRRIFEAAGQTESDTPPQPEATPEPLNEPEPEPEFKQRGRPRGKKSDPEFVSAIAYIRKKTHLQVKRLLLDKEEQGEKQDFSELVQDLLDFWVKFSKVKIQKF